MENYSITNAQKRIIYTEMLYSEPRISNEGGVYIINTPFNAVRLVKAIVSILNSSEVFRTLFCQNEEGDITQIYRSHEFVMSDIPVFSNEEAFDSYKEDALNFKFNIFDDYLFKFGIYQGEVGGQLFVLFHHAIADAYSIGMIAKDIFDIYEGKKTPIVSGYTSYIESEIEYQQSNKDYESDKLYWQNRFKESEHEFEFSPRNSQAGNFYFTIGNRDKTKWENFLKDNKLNENIFLITLLNAYQYKITGKANGVMGVPYYNRRNKIFSHTYGMFASTVPFVYRIESESTIKDFYRENKRNLVKDIKHSSYPYNILISDLGANGKVLFDWNFNYYVDNMNYLLGEVPIEVKESTPKYLPFPVNIIYRRFQKQANEIEIVYNKEIYTQEEIKHLVANFMSFVKNVVNKSIYEKINNIGVASEEFSQSVLCEECSHLKAFDFNKSLGLFERFQREVDARKYESALVLEGRQISYSQLDSFVKNRAREFENLDFPNRRVAIVAYKELDTFISILALVSLKITYVPIDPEYPQGRREYILKDSNCSHYIDHEQILVNVNYDELQEKTENIPLYILYTSGTTGTPKGVMIQEKGIMRLLDDPNILELIKSIDIFLQVNSLGFDISELEIWGALSTGKTLEIIPKAYLFETKKLSKLLDNNFRFGAILSVTLLEQLFAANSKLFQNFTFIITGGEQVKKELVENLYHINSRVKIINGYGPTENSVLSTLYTIPRDYPSKMISIGKSLNGSSAYIIDNTGKICAPHQVGEIVVGGDGVASGYLNRERLNKEKFYYSKAAGKEKLYHTGDFGFYDSEGKIFIKGREDSQIKLNGQRIEIQEIETTIYEVLHDKSGSVNVTVIDGAIVCFYTHANVNVLELRNKLKNILTSAMIPKFFIEISNLPINVNGKLDEKRLFDTFKQWLTRNGNQKNKKTNFKRNEALERLLRGSVNYEKSFIENGGDSLDAMKFINYFSRQGKTIQLNDLLSSNPLSEILNTVVDKVNNFEIEKYDGTIQRASMIQQELFFDDKFNHVKFKYNSPMVFEINKRFPDLDDFLYKVENFLNAQRLLRSHFVLSNGEIFLQTGDDRIIIQKVHSEKQFSTDVVKEHLTDFDVEHKLFNAEYIETPNVDLLLFDFHHSIFDGASRKNFVNLINEFLRDEFKQNQKFDYYDYLNSLNKITLEKKEKFWKEKISKFGKLDAENLETSEKNVSNYQEIQLTTEQRREISEISKNNSLTISTLLLSVFVQTKKEIYKNKVNTVGITLSTRNDEILSDMVGPFFNVLPLTIIHESDDLRKNVEKIGKLVRDISEYADYPSSKIDSFYKAFCGEYASSLMDWMFVFNHYDDVSLNYKNMNFSEVMMNDTVQAKYALSIIINVDSHGELLIGFEYSQKYYNKEEINKIMHVFKVILDKTIESFE